MMGFEIKRDGIQACISLKEKLTAMEVPALQPALKQEIHDGICKIIFDLSGTVSIDSTGIGLLIATNNSLSAVQGSISLINVSPDIFKLLQSMRLVERLHAAMPKKEASNG